MQDIIYIYLAASLKDYNKIKKFLAKNGSVKFELVWTENLDDLLKEFKPEQQGIYLIDDKLVENDGLKKLRDTLGSEIVAPIILLTDQDDLAAHDKSLQAGAADVLPRDQLNPFLLKRGIIYLLEHTRMTEALNDAENRYGTLEKLFNYLMENAYDWEYWIDPLGNIIYMSSVCQHITGYQPEEFIKDPMLLLAIIHPEGQLNVEDHIKERPDDNQPGEYSIDFRIVAKNGSIHWISHQCQAVYDNSGKYLARRVNNRDITERKQAEENLRKSESTFRQLAETISDVFWLITSDDNIYISPTYESVYGRSRTSFYENPSTFIEAIHPEDRKRVIDAYLSDEYQVRGRFNQEYRIIRPDKNIRWIRARTFLVKNKDEPPRIVGIAEDITERKKTEQALIDSEKRLYHSEEKYRILVENFPNGAVYLFDPDFRLILAGGTGINELGFSIKYHEGEKLAECFPSEIYNTIEPFLKKALRGQVNVVDVKYVNHIHEINIMPVKDKQGDVIAGLIMTQDITNHRQMKEDLKKVNETLSQHINELQKHNREANVLNRMGELIQSCQTVKEAYGIVEKYLPKLFPGQPGTLYILDSAKNYLETVAVWGKGCQSDAVFAQDSCWALRRGQIHVAANTNIGLRCQHLGKESENLGIFPYLCVPLIARGETFGVIHIHLDPAQPTDQWETLALTVSRWVAPALVNLELGERLRTLSILDPLTALFNRRYMEETLKRELSRATRHQHQIGLLMLDIDHFKIFNDTFGHSAGDAVLRELGSYLQTNIRGEDFACRYGGEEFVLILPQTSLEDSCKRAEQIREGFKHLSMKSSGRTIRKITVSIGVACYPENGQTIEQLIRSADRALYKAKDEGRDRVVCAQNE